MILFPMLASVHSAAVFGIDAYDVIVEVDVALGLPQWVTVGLTANAVKESRERVGSALLNSGFTVPPRRITTNLAPADRRKEGTAFDLPIALGVLIGAGEIDRTSADRCVVVGELGLDGSIRPIRGALSIARRVVALGDGHQYTLILPTANVGEAALVHGLRIAAPVSLGELVRWLRVGVLPPPTRVVPPEREGLPVSDGLSVHATASSPRAKQILHHRQISVSPPGWQTPVTLLHEAQ